MISRQRKEQLARLATGKCEFCSLPAVTKRHCDKCRKRVNRLRLARYWRQKIAGMDVH